jgi:hypothetical protein
MRDEAYGPPKMSQGLRKMDSMSEHTIPLTIDQMSERCD